MNGLIQLVRPIEFFDCRIPKVFVFTLVFREEQGILVGSGKVKNRNTFIAEIFKG